MRLMGMMPVCHRKHLSKLGSASYIKPYLLRGLDIDHRNHVWCVDITYIPMKKGFMYLTAIIDAYSRFILGWSLHNSLDASHCIEVLQNANATYAHLRSSTQTRVVSSFARHGLMPVLSTL